MSIPHNSSFTQLFDENMTQHGIPSTIKISPDLPSLEVEEDPVLLSCFVSLCKLFQTFDKALSTHSPTTDSRTMLSPIYQQFQQVPALSPYNNEMQRTEVSVTQQWMQVVVWKFAMPYVTLTTESDNPSFSFSFPVVVARQLLSDVGNTPIDTLLALGVAGVSILWLAFFCSKTDAQARKTRYTK